MERAVSAGLPVFSDQTRLLVVAPHPDDETLATGILLQQVQAAGGAVRVLLLTAGDNNPWPQRWVERRLRIGPDERERWGRRRHKEILGALNKLDIAPGALQPLGWPDMGLTDYLMKPAHRVVDVLTAAIDDFAPTVIAMPSLLDRHPDHGAAHVMVRLAVAKAVCKPQLLAYLVHGRTQGVSYMSLAGSIVQQASKQAALQEHQSQMTLSGRRMRRWAARPERYVEVPSAAPVATRVLPWRPSPWMRPWLRLTLASAASTGSWRWSDAPLQLAPDGSFHLTTEAGEATSPNFVKLVWNMHSFWIFDRWGWCEL